jgi:hypothetical protein
MNNLEALMREVVRSSVHLKHNLYRRDNFASTSPEGTEGPRIVVHACLVCNRAAAGKEAHVRHRSNCELARLQRAQKALWEAWPELFAPKPSPAMPAAAPPVKCVTHLSGNADPVDLAPADGGSGAFFPPPALPATRRKGRGHHRARGWIESRGFGFSATCERISLNANRYDVEALSR